MKTIRTQILRTTALLSALAVTSLCAANTNEFPRPAATTNAPSSSARRKMAGWT